MPRGIESRALLTLKKVFKEYIGDTSKTSSPALTKILHGWVQQELKSALPGYEIIGLSSPDSKEKKTASSSKEKQQASGSKERKIAGRYYDKDVDICVRKDGRDLGVISVKFVRSNYRQNANNYFEGQMGETANLRSNNIVYAHLMILTDPIIYFKSGKKFKKYEHVNDTDVKKYAILSEDHERLHAPDVQCLVLATISRNETNLKNTKLLRLSTRKDLGHLSDDSWNKLQGPLGLKNFFTRFVSHVKNKHLDLSAQGSDTDSN